MTALDYIHTVGAVERIRHDVPGGDGFVKQLLDASPGSIVLRVIDGPTGIGSGASDLITFPCEFQGDAVSASDLAGLFGLDRTVNCGLAVEVFLANRRLTVVRMSKDEWEALPDRPHPDEVYRSDTGLALQAYVAECEGRAQVAVRVVDIYDHRTANNGVSVYLTSIQVEHLAAALTRNFRLALRAEHGRVLTSRPLPSGESFFATSQPDSDRVMRRYGMNLPRIVVLKLINRLLLLAKVAVSYNA